MTDTKKTLHRHCEPNKVRRGNLLIMKKTIQLTEKLFLINGIDKIHSITILKIEVNDALKTFIVKHYSY